MGRGQDPGGGRRSGERAEGEKGEKGEFFRGKRRPIIGEEIWSDRGAVLCGEDSKERMSDLWKRGGGGGAGGGASSGAQGAAADVLEKQNEEALGSLQAKIAAMKNVSASLTTGPCLCTHAQTHTSLDHFATSSLQS